MGKSVLVLSFVGISLLFVLGITHPDTPAMWLASSSESYTYLRFGMMIALLTLLFTNPPRNVILRTIVGFFAVGMAYWALSATYQNTMMFLDTMAILQFSISAVIAVLERDLGAVTSLEPAIKKSKTATT